MKKLLTLICFIATTALWSSCVEECDCGSNPETIVDNSLIEDGYTSVQDPTFISQNDPNEVYNINIRNSEEQEENAYIRFNSISTIEAPVDKAILKLFIKGTPEAVNSTFAFVLSAIKEDWDETTINYSNSPTANNADTIFFAPDTLSDKNLFELDVTDIMQDLYESGDTHQGFALALINNNDASSESLEVTFYSSESTESSLWPALDITYQDETDTPDFPEIIYSVYDGQNDIEFYKASYATGATQYTTEKIGSTVNDDNVSPFICVNYDDSDPEDIYFLDSYYASSLSYDFVLRNINDTNNDIYLSAQDVIDSALFIEDMNDNLFIGGVSKENGTLSIMKVSSNTIEDNVVGSVNLLSNIYTKNVSGDVMQLIDMEEDEDHYVYMLHWLEVEENSGDFRVMTYNDLSTSCSTLFDNSDFEESFKPKAFTRTVNHTFIVGDTDTEKGVFYDVTYNTAPTKIEVNSDYKDNITDLKVDFEGEYLYWMNDSDDNGGIMRVSINGGDGEVAYGGIIHGYSFEIPPYPFWF